MNDTNVDNVPLDPVADVELSVNDNKAEAADDSELDISLGDDVETEEVEIPEDAPAWIKKTRELERKTSKENRELARKNRELEQALKAKETQSVTVLRDKPTLEAFDYDTEAYDADLIKWYDEKREADNAENAKLQQIEAANKAYQEKVTHYNENKIKLRDKGFDEAEAEVTSRLNVTQQGILLSCAQSPEKLVFAIGKNSQFLDQLTQAANDPVKTAYLIGIAEEKMRANSKKTPPPPPETRLNGRGSGQVNQQKQAGYYSNNEYRQF